MAIMLTSFAATICTQRSDAMQMVQILSGQHVSPLPDPFRIGQASVARITCATAMELMGDCAPLAFGRGHAPEAVRAARRATFSEARAQYERAKKIIEASL